MTSRLLGLRCDVVTKEEIVYIFFYDIDMPNLSDDNLAWIDETLRGYCVSYLVYKTKNGYHVIGLTPLPVLQWAMLQKVFKNQFNSYYGGIVIRVSRKPQEEQVLIRFIEEYGEVIPNLWNIYCSRFEELQRKPWVKELAKYLLVFERYRSEKQ